jgi:phage recombination protein Bet
MTAAITRVEPNVLATVETFRFTQDQRKLILDTCCGGASPSEAQVLLGIAEMRGLNPLTQECYFVQRWDSQKQRMVWAVQISIDAMRIKAEESGLYAGQDEPEYEYDPGSKVPSLARIRIYRRDWDRPCVGVARYSEYVQKKKDGTVTKFWHDMPHNQLAKCAEAIGLRKAFPKRLAKLYTADEMAQADTGHPDVLPARPASTPPPALQNGGESSALWSQFSAHISQAPDLAALKAIGGVIKLAGDQGKLTLTQLAELRDLTKARQKAIKAGKPVAEVMADAGVGELPAAWGGPEEKGPSEVCMFCSAGFEPGEPHIEHTDGDGCVGVKHEGCSAFGNGAP